MGNRTARRQARIDAAHDRYTHCLLYLGPPPTKQIWDGETQRFHGVTGRKPGATFHRKTVYDFENIAYRTEVGEFYLDTHEGKPLPGRKAQNKFVRGYIRWLRRKFDEKQTTE